MYRTFSAISSINNNTNINTWATNLQDPMYITEMVEVGDVDAYGEAQCGTFLVEDEEAARLVIERALGREEHVLYPEDEKSPISNSLDIDKLAQLVELQIRMENGLEMIKEQTLARDVLREEYYGLKDRIAKGGEMLNEWKAQGNSFKTWPHHALMNKLHKERNTIGRNLGASNEKLSKYWELWMALKEECTKVVGRDRYLWVAFFEIQDKEAWFENYINDCLYNDTDDHLKSDPHIDNRMLVSHQAYCLAHLEECTL